VPAVSDPLWPNASGLLGSLPKAKRRNVALVGVPTYETSVTPRSSRSTPQAVRAALARYSTYSFTDDLDLADHVNVVDYGDVTRPDGPEGHDRVSNTLSLVDPSCDTVLVLGGDNALTYTVLHRLAGRQLASWGLVTFDAHLDLRDGVSNGSPVRQLLAEGLPGSQVVQVGLADFSNSARYASRARDAGVTIIPRSVLRERTVEDVVREALAVAGADGRPVYVDVDMDVVDRAAVPGCPAAAPGGLAPDELRRAVRALAADPRVRAIDFTEVDAARDSSDERSVRLVALCVLEALAGIARRPS